MSSNKKTALIAGATGLVGSELLQLLLNNSYYDKIILLLRKPVEITDKKVVQVVLDFDDLKKHTDSLKTDDVFCTLGTTIKKAGSQDAFRKVDYTYPLELARISKAHGANKFLIVTALGANANSLVFYNRVKGEIEDSLQQLNLPHLYIFRPSLLVGKRNEKRPGERLGVFASKIINPLLHGAFMRYRSIEAEAVAYAMMQIAQHASKKSEIIESDMIQKIFDKNQPQ